MHGRVIEAVIAAHNATHSFDAINDCSVDIRVDRLRRTALAASASVFVLLYQYRK